MGMLESRSVTAVVVSEFGILAFADGIRAMRDLRDPFLANPGRLEFTVSSREKA